MSMAKTLHFSGGEALRAFKRGGTTLVRHSFVGFDCIWFA
jgi:hypothetical protein